jgi:hypothetical protein
LALWTTARRNQNFQFLLRIVIAIGHAGLAIPTALTTTRKVIAMRA